MGWWLNKGSRVIYMYDLTLLQSSLPIRERLAQYPHCHPRLG